MLVIGETSYLGKALHALGDFDVYMVLVDEGPKVVVVHDGLGDVADVYIHVFCPRHGCVEVEVLDITREGAGRWS